jgi:ATP-dependent Zn protease
MDKDTAAAPVPIAADPFRSAAAQHRSSVRQIRERNRQRRLRYLLYLNLVAFAYLLRRVIDNNPLRPRLPHLGADALIWLLPVLLILLMSSVLLMPLINGRSPHIKFTASELGVGFADVRGIDTVVEEVTRTLQIFLTYKEFREELGGNPRRGILFEGKPGTGKTHLAKAMAAEAGVPFFFVSGPAFQSMWFGMTAWKIRSYFKALKKAARREGGAIGFIEEIDAVGSSRGEISQSSGLGRRSLARMTSPGTGGMVNELLIQMQSFDAPTFGKRLRGKFVDLVNLFMPAHRQWHKPAVPYHNVLIIGATNLAEGLDTALLRPGRFDRILHFELPSRAGRLDLVDYFLDRRSHAAEMDRDDLRAELASMTLGYTPAMLEHVLDEALVWALRDARRELTWKDIQRARLTEEIGLAQPVEYTVRERRAIATHEAGHAVAAYLCAKERKLEVLSIIKRRTALGLLAHSDTEERFTRTQSELEGTLRIALAGMAAEEIFFGESGTGPASDLTAATQLAAQMVGSFGMGRSLVSWDAVHYPAGPNIVAKVLSNEDARAEVEELLRSHREAVGTLLIKNRDLVEALRDALLDRDELLGEEILHVLADAERHRIQ